MSSDILPQSLATVTQSVQAVDHPEILKKVEWGRQCISPGLPFVANSHNELYTFYTEKSDFLKKKSKANGEGGA